MAMEFASPAPLGVIKPSVKADAARSHCRQNESGVEAIYALQRSVGNRQVAKLAQSRRLMPPGQIVQGTHNGSIEPNAGAATSGPSRDTLGRAQIAPVLPTASVQRQNHAPPAGDDLTNRVAVLERQQAATEMDLRWRARFGSRLSVYRQAIYALTAGFHTAATQFGQAHDDQARAEAMKDQVAIAIINLGAAGAAEPFLRTLLGGLGPRLAGLVETVENPAIQAAQGVTTVIGTMSSQTGSQRPVAAPPPSMTGGDPLTFLAQNLQEVEHRNQLIEEAFAGRATRMQGYSADQWMHWDQAQQEAQYALTLRALDGIALSDIAQLEAAPTLAVKLELYFWSRWLNAEYIPGVRGLQLGAPLARRLRALGVESLAGGIHFDTTSWIFMSHQPSNWDVMLVTWARGYVARLTR